MMKWIFSSATCVIIVLATFGFAASEKGAKIEWLSLEEAQARNAETPKKIIIDFYTDWCGWCKKMDAGAFTDPVIVDYISTHYYAVKFNAETTDTVLFKGQEFYNPFAGQRPRSTHQIAANMCAVDGRIGYPTLVYLDEDLSIIAPVPAYQTAQTLEPLITFIAEDRYKTEKYPEFKASFKGKAR